MKHEKTVFYSSFAEAVEGLQRAFQDGWELDKGKPPEVVGFDFVLHLEHEDEPPVRLTRAEILAKARAAKTAKKTEN